MQKKESKTNWHFNLSIAKSGMRIFAFFLLGYKDFVGAASMLFFAEVVGIVEEF